MMNPYGKKLGSVLLAALLGVSGLSNTFAMAAYAEETQTESVTEAVGEDAAEMEAAAETDAEAVAAAEEELAAEAETEDAEESDDMAEAETETETEIETEAPQIELVVDSETVIVTDETGLGIVSLAFETAAETENGSSAEAGTAENETSGGHLQRKKLLLRMQQKLPGTRSQCCWRRKRTVRYIPLRMSA